MRLKSVRLQIQNVLNFRVYLPRATHMPIWVGSAFTHKKTGFGLL
jgi:hypothetical protein